MTKTCKNYPWQVLQLTFSPKKVKILIYHLKSVVKLYFMFCILAESGRGRRSMAEKADESNGTVRQFKTWQWNVLKKGSVIPQAVWQSGRLGTRWMFHRAELLWITSPILWSGLWGKGEGLTCHARFNRSPSGAPHQSFSMSYMSNQSVHFCLA